MNNFYQVRVLEQWPGELHRFDMRQRAPFRTEWPRTEQLLEREIVRHLRGKDVVFELALDAYDIRLDGGLRTNARPTRHPGIVISFGSRHGPQRYFTDKYTDWRGNARAIALGLEALRAVDRYGITRRGEQYTGFGKLPAPAADMSVDEALELLRTHGGFRAAAMKTHPDVGGDAVLFRRVTAAKAKLEAAGIALP